MRRQLAEFWVIVTADRRKATTLLVLLLLLAGMSVRTALFSGPSRSEAAMSDRVSQVNSLAAAGKGAVSRTLASLSSPGHDVVRVPSCPRLVRNLFAIEDAYFPPPVKATRAKPARTESAPARPQAPIETADEVRARREASITDEARAIQLKSVVVGGSPMAVFEIPGSRGKRTVVSRGQTIEGFTLIEVSSNSVVLEKESVRVRLELTLAEK